MTAGTVRVERVVLREVTDAWDFAGVHAAAIAAHWARRSAEQPAFFNGTILLLRRFDVGGGTFAAEFSRESFASFLYWREQGHRDPTVHDGFGSALVRSVEGHVLLGRQSAGHLNSGLAYPPGGFLDPRDVDAGGQIDIDASIQRELAEELAVDDRIALRRMPGYWVTVHERQISIAIEFRSALSADALRSELLAGLAVDPERELLDVVIVRRPGDMAALQVTPYAAALLRHVLDAGD